MAPENKVIGSLAQSLFSYYTLAFHKCLMCVRARFVAGNWGVRVLIGMIFWIVGDGVHPTGEGVL